jgi:hypothetical protein
MVGWWSTDLGSLSAIVRYVGIPAASDSCPSRTVPTAPTLLGVDGMILPSLLAEQLGCSRLHLPSIRQHPVAEMAGPFERALAECGSGGGLGSVLSANC